MLISYEIKKNVKNNILVNIDVDGCCDEPCDDQKDVDDNGPVGDNFIGCSDDPSVCGGNENNKICCDSEVGCVGVPIGSPPGSEP